MFKPKPLFIIPARGGSKGIPRKNIRPLAGKPLIAYSIENVRDAGGDDSNIILSTEDDEIARVARNYGLKVEYMRPPELATDFSGTREAIIDAMDWADSHGMTYNCVVLIQPTSPLRKADDILNAIKLYSPEIDMVVSVCESASNPYFNLFEADPATGFLHISKGTGLIARRQDAPKVWEYNGAVYVINPESVRKMPLGAFPKRIPYIMGAERSIDLDTPDDWQRAEQAIMNSCRGNKAEQACRRSPSAHGSCSQDSGDMAP